ncbi:hypothetical protein EP47_13215 [Legionella norrlandica]|uniref:Lipoprotein n=1 Tax=Legionella norrlandica TaxID=1498499 RepID=A0A0A2SRK6_9GAMM|nr:hypothetical protein [Legionella norrlandica]KGP62341.1 hypothetical protein EP47_13215 [Legionella norrlandica]
MINFKSIKWRYGVIAIFVLSISGCYLDGTSPQERGYSQENVSSSGVQKAKVTTESQAQQKSNVSQDSVQKSTPGPRHTAAPQLPVIQ